MATFRNKVITLGCDPELFLSNNSGEIVSGIGIVGGTKHNPLPCKGGAMQEDGIAAEFNTNPATTPKAFIETIHTVMGELSSKVHPLKLEIISHKTFTPEFFKTAGPQAMEMGCEADFDAWTLEMNETPNAHSLMRTAAGHVHIGFSMDDDLDAYRAAILMDFYVGLPSVLLDPEGGDRRAMYGKAGACRPKEYGVEYRVPSNFWLKSDKMMRWMWDSSIKAIQNLDRFDELRKKYDGVVSEIINTSDRRGAERVMREVGVAF